MKISNIQDELIVLEEIQMDVIRGGVFVLKGIRASPTQVNLQKKYPVVLWGIDRLEQPVFVSASATEKILSAAQMKNQQLRVINLDEVNETLRKCHKILWLELATLSFEKKDFCERVLL